MAGDLPPPPPPPAEGACDEIVWESSIVNEFGAARIRKINTRNGERLEIAAPKLGYCIRLDALQLEAISWQTEQFISELLETPFGPEDKSS